MTAPFGYMAYSVRLVILLFCCLPFLSPDLSAQVGANVDFSRSAGDSLVLINIRWSGEDELAWHTANDERLDIMSLKTNIHAEDLPKSQSNITSYHFQFPTSASVELMVEIEAVASGEEIYLWDVAQGKIIASLSGQTKNRFLTPEFNPATTFLVWKTVKTGTFESKFIISNIYYEKADTRRGGIGFGAALECHPNIACKQDSMMQLISGSAVRIRLVMEEGIGWCTGSFVNNARNDRTPYLLTAFHCQFNFTPFYDMWRFDFQYQSLTCPNPVSEPQYFSMTGCERIAGRQGSDFLLVLLDQSIPAQQQMTFAGWNNDEAAIPDTSYLIHHPRADIRKISTCSTTAVIHPNQIGWSEGYNTPANHHFRFKFTEGGHEAGSSGGPVFNEDGYLVGQLHGGTVGCEVTNNAFTGRFSRSWNMGATSEERLMDWLDPDQTGLTTLPSIRNINANDIVDIHGLISDTKDRPIKNATIRITGAEDRTLITDEDGRFVLSGANRNGQYIITPEKNDHPANGLSALDLVAIQKHLLAKDTFDFAWQHIAADATGNNDTSVGDIVLILRLLLGKIQTFPSAPSWKFDPPQVIIDTIPPGEPVEIRFMGIKMGDVNGTADPQL